MAEYSILISLMALLISAFTAWFTLFRRGSLRMTQPTMLYFGPDISQDSADDPPPKIFLRTLLFTTGKRGRMLESMHLKVTRSETVQNFNIWVYGNEKLVRGSGLFVGEHGVSANHHFLVPFDGSKFYFVAGEYRLELFAKILDARTEQRIWFETLIISKENEAALKTYGAGIFFDWGPDSKSYMSHIAVRPPQPSVDEYIDRLAPKNL